MKLNFLLYSFMTVLRNTIIGELETDICLGGNIECHYKTN